MANGRAASSGGNATQLLHLHPYETTVVHKFYGKDSEARLNFLLTGACIECEQ
jgi:hypothetical protein